MTIKKKQLLKLSLIPISTIVASVIITPIVTSCANDSSKINITLQTKACNVIVGGTIEITANVTGGSGNYTYQWYHNGAIILNQNKSTLTIENVKQSDEGYYYVQVVDAKYNWSNHSKKINIIVNTNISTIDLSELTNKIKEVVTKTVAENQAKIYEGESQEQVKQILKQPIIDAINSNCKDLMSGNEVSGINMSVDTNHNNFTYSIVFKNPLSGITDGQQPNDFIYSTNLNTLTYSKPVSYKPTNSTIGVDFNALTNKIDEIVSRIVKEKQNEIINNDEESNKLEQVLGQPIIDAINSQCSSLLGDVKIIEIQFFVQPDKNTFNYNLKLSNELKGIVEDQTNKDIQYIHDVNGFHLKHLTPISYTPTYPKVDMNALTNKIKEVVTKTVAENQAKIYEGESQEQVKQILKQPIIDAINSNCKDLMSGNEVSGIKMAVITNDNRFNYSIVFKNPLSGITDGQQANDFIYYLNSNILGYINSVYYTPTNSPSGIDFN